MPRPKQWELFDKMFRPEIKRINASDKPKVIQGARIIHVIIDEHLLLQESPKKEK